MPKHKTKPKPISKHAMKKSAKIFWKKKITAQQSTKLQVKFPVSSGQQHRKAEVITREKHSISQGRDQLPVNSPQMKTTIQSSTVSSCPSQPVKNIGHIAMELLWGNRSLPVFSGQQQRKAEVIRLETQTIASGRQQQPGNSTEIKTKIQSSTVSSCPSQPVKNIGHIAMELLWGSRLLPVLHSSPENRAPSAVKTVSQNIRCKPVPQRFAQSTDIEVASVAPSSSQAIVGHETDDHHFTTTSVSGGVGMSLLQKMGWQPGEGLGKYKEGLLEPVSVTLKLDKRGLSTKGDLKRCTQNLKRGRPISNSNRHKPKLKKVIEKNPVVALTELCVQRRFGIPQFDLCQVGGPDHMKTFLLSVRVNGVVYKPTFASQNKKLAKAEAATFCLRALSVLNI